jgi:flavin reductase (DIM6/NTAB) family NADH-FMN oxidoreductase RutF
VTIHSSDPFATPEDARAPVRRLRGRLPSGVALWTAVGAEGRPAGLTVASTLIADGAPGRVLGLVDDESDLWSAVRHSGRFAVCPLRASDRRLADTFGGVMPAAGSAFAGDGWRTTHFGPVLDGVAGWAGCHLDDARRFGWGLLVEATVDHVEIGTGEVPEPLVHFHGRYLAGPAG